jgi:hypothetical protein
VKNRVAPPVGETELEILYPLGSQPLADYVPRVTEAPIHVIAEIEPCASAVV